MKVKQIAQSNHFATSMNAQKHDDAVRAQRMYVDTAEGLFKSEKKFYLFARLPGRKIWKFPALM